MQTNLGTKSDPAKTTDVDGTITAFLRGLVVLTLAMSAKLPAALGRLAAGASTSVALCIEDAAVFAPPATGTTSTVAASATNVTLKVANVSRKALTIWNDSTSILYVKHGETATATDCKAPIAPGERYELPFPVYTGIVDGIWAVANGNARITEEV